MKKQLISFTLGALALSGLSASAVATTHNTGHSMAPPFTDQNDNMALMFEAALPLHEYTYQSSLPAANTTEAQAVKTTKDLTIAAQGLNVRANFIFGQHSFQFVNEYIKFKKDVTLDQAASFEAHTHTPSTVSTSSQNSGEFRANHSINNTMIGTTLTGNSNFTVDTGVAMHNTKADSKVVKSTNVASKAKGDLKANGGYLRIGYKAEKRFMTNFMLKPSVGVLARHLTSKSDMLLTDGSNNISAQYPHGTDGSSTKGTLEIVDIATGMELGFQMPSDSGEGNVASIAVRNTIPLATLGSHGELYQLFQPSSNYELVFAVKINL